MPPTAQHEALHRIFQRDEALFARAVARVFNVMVPAPVDVTVLGSREHRGVYRDGARRHGRPADMEGTDGDPDLPVRIADAPASS